MSQSPEGSCQLCEVLLTSVSPSPGFSLNPPKGPASFARTYSEAVLKVLATMSQSPEGSCQLCEEAGAASPADLREGLNPPKGPASFASSSSARGRKGKLCVSIPRRVLPALREDRPAIHAGRWSRLNPPKGPASFARTIQTRDLRYDTLNVSIPRRVLPALRGLLGSVGSAVVGKVSQSPEGSCQLCEINTETKLQLGSFKCLNPPKGPASFASFRALVAARAALVSQSPEGSCQLCELLGNNSFLPLANRSQSPEGS